MKKKVIASIIAAAVIHSSIYILCSCDGNNFIFFSSRNIFWNLSSKIGFIQVRIAFTTGLILSYMNNFKYHIVLNIKSFGVTLKYKVYS